MARRSLAALISAVAVFIILPSIAFAATASSILVPCGIGTDAMVATGCQACNLVQLIQNIIMFLIGLSIPIAAGMFTWAGVLYFTSATGPENISKAKRIFSSTMFGFVLAVGGWLIINTLLVTILDSKQYPNSSWFHIDCSVDRDRIRDATIDKVITEALGVGTSAFSDAPASFTEVCEPGYTYKSNAISTDEGGCVSNTNPSDIKTAKILTVGGNNAVCSGGNTACSPAALMAAGVSQARANALSCIAVTESSGNPASQSTVSSACGTWQILDGNWKALNISGCGPSTCNNVSCNMKAAIALGDDRKAHGGSYYGDWTCPNCNAKAAACVAAYDPGN